jgi:hypothetical protein
MKDGKFESQQERLRFLEKAGDEGVYLKIHEPGIPCGIFYPKPCLNIATVVEAVYNLVSGWALTMPLCREHATRLEKSYDEGQDVKEM